MGGGHLSRPDFGMPQPNPDHPLTEFYQLLQRGLDREGRVCAARASMQPFRPRPGTSTLTKPPITSPYRRPGGEPHRCSRPGCSKFYTAASTSCRTAPGGSSPHRSAPRTVYAVQLQPPPLSGRDPLPPLPDCAAALTLTLTLRDVEAIDADPRRAGPAALPGSGGQALARPTPRPIPTSPGGLRCSSDCTNVRILLYSFSFYPCNNWGISAVY